MKKQQLILIAIGFVLLVSLFFFGKTVPASTNAKTPVTTTQNSRVQFSDILSEAKKHISSQQNQYLVSLENTVIRGDVKEQQMHVYHQLARFWKDSVHVFEPYIYYTAEAAKLENSEKSLTFAAQQMIDRMLSDDEPAMQNWLASNAKVLLDKALQINPNNDSSKINLGACYMLGNISDNPMQGILPVREIVQKNPNNLYAQLILGLGGKKSGQYDKAIEHFNVIVQQDPKNLEAIFNLAECYQLKNDKPNAIKWYNTAKSLISNEQILKEIDKRINELK